MLKKIITLCLCFLGLAAHAQTKDSIGIAVPDSLYQQQLLELDSVQENTKKEFSKLKSEYESIGKQFEGPLAQLQHQADSARDLNLPTDAYTTQLDSLTQLREAKLATVKSKTEALKERSISKINGLKLPPEISNEAQQFTKGLNKLDVSLPEANLNFPTMPSLALPGISMQGLQTPALQGLSTPDLKTSLPTDVVKTPAILGEATEMAGDAKEITGQVGEVANKVKTPPSKEEIKKEASEEAESAVKNSKPVKDVTEKLGGNELPLKDGQLSQEELKAEVKKQAVDHFAGKEKQLQDAMSQMSKLKQKHSSVQSIKDLPKKAPNPMKKKPFIERFVPGMLFQIHQMDDWMIDVNPYAGYRVNGKLTVGAGWNHRFAFNNDQHEFSQADVYGPRAYAEYDLFKGFQPRIEFELMRTQVPSFNQSGEPANREWVRTMFLGFNKKYKISKHIKGTSSIMYNMFDVNHRSPYSDKFVVRFGLELALKKKEKKKETVSKPVNP